MDTITLTNGTDTVVLANVVRKSAPPELSKNFSQFRLADNTIVYDVYASPKRRWSLRVDVPLDSTDKTALSNLFATNEPITLTEDLLEPNVPYTVFFEAKRLTIESQLGDFHYDLVFQEL